MAIVKHKDKRSGITYAYESKSIWNKEKKQSLAVRTLIGRVDPDTGEIVPTDGRGKKRSPNYHPEVTMKKSNVTDIPSLQKKISALEIENAQLKKQIAVLTKANPKLKERLAKLKP